MNAEKILSSAIYGAAALVFFWMLAKGIATGGVKPGAALYDRRERPVEYCFWIGYAALFAAAMAWLIARELGEAPPSRATDLLMLFLVGAPAAFGLVRGLQSGSIRCGRFGPFTRRDAPRIYWPLLIVHAAVAAAAAVLAARALSLR